jgi:hypothetical protein
MEGITGDAERGDSFVDFTFFLKLWWHSCGYIEIYFGEKFSKWTIFTITFLSTVGVIR